MREKVLGLEHPDVAESLNDRAVFLSAQVKAVILFWEIIVDEGLSERSSHVIVLWEAFVVQ